MKVLTSLNFIRLLAITLIVLCVRLEYALGSSKVDVTVTTAFLKQLAVTSGVPESSFDVSKPAGTVTTVGKDVDEVLFLVDAPYDLIDHLVYSVSSLPATMASPLLSGSALDQNTFDFVEDGTPTTTPPSPIPQTRTLNVAFHCQEGGIAMIEIVITLPDSTTITFGLRKKCLAPPLAGFSVYGGSDYQPWSIVVQDGFVSPDFLPAVSKISLQPEDIIMRFNLWMQRSNLLMIAQPVLFVNNAPLDSSQGLKLALIGEISHGGFVADNSTSFAVVHDCVSSGTYTVSVQLVVIRLKNGGRNIAAGSAVTAPADHGVKGSHETIMIGWSKTCNVGNHPDLDITMGSYIPYNTDFYPVINGKLTSAFEHSMHSMVVRSEEEWTRFYVNVRRSPLQVLDPVVSVPDDVVFVDDAFGTQPVLASVSVSVRGVGDMESYDNINNIRPGSDPSFPHNITPQKPLIFEVHYKCQRTGSSVIVISFTIVNAGTNKHEYMTFSWTKECEVLDIEEFHIGSSLDGVNQFLATQSTAMDLSTSSLDVLSVGYADVVYRGAVQDQFHTYTHSALVGGRLPSKSFFLYVIGGRNITVGRPTVTSNNYQLRSTIGGPLTLNDLTIIKDDPVELDVNFGCLVDDGVRAASIVTVHIPINPLDADAHDIRFSFMKRCGTWAGQWNAVRDTSIVSSNLLLVMSLVTVLIILLACAARFGYIKRLRGYQAVASQEPTLSSPRPAAVIRRERIAV